MTPQVPTVLVAEDDSIIRQSLAFRLILAGFDVITAVDGRDAEDVADHQHIDAAILDVKMPRRDGFEVCQHIRTRGSEIPILLLNSAEEGVLRTYLGVLTKVVGGTHYMTKPYDARVLAMTLQEALSKEKVRV